MVFADSISKNRLRRFMLDLEKIRKDFPILEKESMESLWSYLDNAATTQKPQVVLDAIVEFYTNSNSNIHRGVHYLSEQASSAYEECPGKSEGYLSMLKMSRKSSLPVERQRQ